MAFIHLASKENSASYLELKCLEQAMSTVDKTVHDQVVLHQFEAGS